MSLVGFSWDDRKETLRIIYTHNDNITIQISILGCGYTGVYAGGAMGGRGL